MGRHDDTLDVARGLAAIAVFVGHLHAAFFWRITGPDTWQAHTASNAAYYAVLVFFLLSGHLITRSIISNIRRNGTFDIADYTASRFARIYPPLLASIALCILVWPLIGTLGLPGDLYRIRETVIISPGEIINAIIMRGGMLGINGPLLTLSLEFQIYILAAVVAVLYSGARLQRFAAVLVGITVAVILRQHWFLFLVWCAGAATAGLRPPAIRWPRLLVATADFSYSLFLIHFPLILLALSVSQRWIGHDMARSTGVAALTGAIIMVASIYFARAFEPTFYFKQFLLRQK